MVVGSPSAGLGSTVNSSLLALLEQEQGLHTALSSHPVYLLCMLPVGVGAWLPQGAWCPSCAQGVGTQTAQVPGPRASPV